METVHTMSLSTILNRRFALRQLLQQTKYHDHDGAIPALEVTVEREPAIREQLAALAAQIVADPNTILLDEYTTDDRSKDWKALEKKEVLTESGDVAHIDTRSRPGHKILDHFMPHFWKVKDHRGLSVFGLMTTEKVQKALLANLMMHSTPYKSEIRRMITMTGGLANVTKYRTVTAKALAQYYGARRVLDPCVGWGGRMLGSLSARSNAVYVGCETDPNTIVGLQQILTDPAIPASVRSRATILDSPVEVVLPQIKLMEKFDMVLTSPPYFNLELYTAGVQSAEVYNTWEEWVAHWLKPVILGCLECLREGGVSCWSVKNIKSDKKYPLADVTKQIHEEAGWKLVKTVTMTGSARPGANRIGGDGKETRESEEETFCFMRSVA